MGSGTTDGGKGEERKGKEKKFREELKKNGRELLRMQRGRIVGRSRKGEEEKGTEKNEYVLYTCPYVPQTWTNKNKIAK